MNLRTPALVPLMALALVANVAFASEADAPDAAARALHERLLTLDSHLDTPAVFARPGWRFTDRHEFRNDFTQVDLPRMKEGGLDGGFFVIYTGQDGRGAAFDQQARDHGLVRLAEIRETIAASNGELQLALTAEDARRIVAQGKHYAFISMENAAPVSADPSLLSYYHQAGLRMLGLVHVKHNDIADSANEAPEWNGLSPKGRELVKQANALGLVLDASHASDAVFDQLLELSTAPIVLSHTSSKAMFDHPRNIDDARIRKLVKKGGVIQVNAYYGYLKDIPKVAERDAKLDALYEEADNAPTLTPQRAAQLAEQVRQIKAEYAMPEATFEDFMRHLLHVLKVAGPEHVGIGADWDGGGGVAGLDDITYLPKITARLLKEGYSETQLAGIWGGNLLRVVEQAQAAAKPH